MFEWPREQSWGMCSRAMIFAGEEEEEEDGEGEEEEETSSDRTAVR